MFVEIQNGKGLDLGKVTQMVRVLVKTGAKNSDIMNCINQIREADEYTYSHSLDTSLIAVMFAKWLKYSESDIRNISKSALLHDIGKVKVSAEIVKKPGRLTDAEMNEMKKHPTYGYDLLLEYEELNEDIMMGVLTHHEKTDGCGYPNGWDEKEIHEFGKIIGIVDIFDAMTARRVYKEPVSHFKVFEMLENNAFI